MVCESVYTSGAPRHAFELALGHALGVANHASLRSSERHIYDRCLPGHPRGECLHFIQGDVGVITDAALPRPASNVVLHAEAGEHLHLAVVHLRRQRYFQHAFRGAQNLPQARIQFQEFRCHIELNLRDTKWIQILARGDARHHRRGANLSCRSCGLCDRGHRRRSFRLLVLIRSCFFHGTRFLNTFVRKSWDLSIRRKFLRVTGIRVAASGGAKVPHFVPLAQRDGKCLVHMHTADRVAYQPARGNFSLSGARDGLAVRRGHARAMQYPADHAAQQPHAPGNHK